jgi:hypothetical protein
LKGLNRNGNEASQQAFGIGCVSDPRIWISFLGVSVSNLTNTMLFDYGFSTKRLVWLFRCGNRIVPANIKSLTTPGLVLKVDTASIEAKFLRVYSRKSNVLGPPETLYLIVLQDDHRHTRSRYVTAGPRISN